MPGFWAGGYSAYCDALQKEYTARNGELRDAFENAPSRETRIRILQERQQLDDAYAAKMQAADRGIY